MQTDSSIYLPPVQATTSVRKTLLAFEGVSSLLLLAKATKRKNHSLDPVFRAWLEEWATLFDVLEIDPGSVKISTRANVVFVLSQRRRDRYV